MKTLPQIRVLPTNVANKIAAGEVVERPASVLKELIENALDTKSTRIDVNIVAGGRKLISITDNGPGMNRDNALLSIERHATSKIRDVDDIEKIGTLGFRGEALAAIASVSRFRLTTCVEGEDTGTEITVTGGKIRDVCDVGCPVGTTVEVRDLFFNVPARRKFLRSQQTELSHVRNCFLVQALSHSEVGMSLKVDDRETYSLSEKSSLKDRVCDLFGMDYHKNLRKLNYKSGEVTVTGFASLPSVARSDRNEQFIFVNNRAASAALISYGIREGYHTLLEKKKHPSVFIFLEMNPDLVDVNVHPTKKEIRFRHPGEARDAVIEAIRKALAPSGSISGVAKYDQEISSNSEAVPELAQGSLKIEDLQEAPVFKYPRMTPVDEVSDPSSPQGSAINPQPAASSPWSFCRVVGQLSGLYVVLETEDGYVLMDPHAAHERVLFEKFTTEVVDGKVQTQALLIPETVKMQPKDAMRVRKNLKVFKEMGFGVSEFGGDTFVVDALPSHFSQMSATTLLNDIAYGLERAGSRGNKGRWREEAIAQSACKAAVKARDKLSTEELKQLVIDLSRTELPYTCPHGRPTMIFTSFRDLHKKFSRE